MKKILPLLILFSIGINAEESFQISPTKFQIKSDNVEEKLEMALKYPERLLKRYQPQGAKISDKKVSGSNIRFKATNTVAFISKTVLVNGILDVTEDNHNCSKNEKGYLITLNLDGSDGLVYDNIDRLEINLCAHYPGPTILNASINGKIIKGSNFSGFVGGMAKDIVDAQTAPLIKALNEEIQALK